MRGYYRGWDIDGDAVFHYVYGVLHSLEYKERFAADLKKMLLHIPYAKTVADFRAFSKAGQQLAELHTGLNHSSHIRWISANSTRRVTRQSVTRCTR